MLPDQMEAEKNRKIIVAQANTIDLLENNVHQLQVELQSAYKRINELTKERETVPIDRNYKGFENESRKNMGYYDAG
tara:strand:- start:2330 stop:2560 length:231 start_codon:yes stop_codon:yes gene_type:complete